MNSSQRLFLQATISSLISASTGDVNLVLDLNGVEILHYTISPGKTVVEIHYTDGSYHASLDEAGERLLDEYAMQGGKILVYSGDRVTELGIRHQSIVRETRTREESQPNQPHWSIGKATHLNPQNASALLKAIGLMTQDGEIKAPMRKKFKQVNHFLDLMLPVLQESNSDRPFAMIDCGCGKSYLGFAAYWYLRKVLNRRGSFLGIDVLQKPIETCQERAEQLHLDGMRFVCSPIREAKMASKPDLIFSLHACDTATDEAIACGTANHARNIIAAPCCQHELARQIEGIPFYPLAKHGIFTQRFSDLLTDMMRSLFLEAHGYTVTAGEFISSDETPKNLLLRAKVGNPNQKERLRQYEEFKKQYKLTPVIDRFLNDIQIQKTLGP